MYLKYRRDHMGAFALLSPITAKIFRTTFRKFWLQIGVPRKVYGDAPWWTKQATSLFVVGKLPEFRRQYH